MTPSSDDDAVAQHLRELESSLLRPDVRQSPRLLELIDDAFVEFGASGRVYTKIDLVDALQAETPVIQTPSDFAVARLAPDVALLTYRIHRHGTPPMHTLRSSLWHRRDGRWTMRFHQATVTAAFP